MAAQPSQILFPGDTVLSYVALAGATCLLYDHIITLDIEIEVNRPKWQIPQFLFFLNRYVGLSLQVYMASYFIKNLLVQSTEVKIAVDMIYLVSPDIMNPSILYYSLLVYHQRYVNTGHVNSGDRLDLVIWCLTNVVFFTMHAIMVYRVSSMYTHDRKILRILVTAYVTECASVLVIQMLARVYGRDLIEDRLVPTPADFCAKEGYTWWIFAIWIPVVLFELLIFTLALTLGIKYYRASGINGMFPSYQNSNRKIPLLYILLRDSIAFPFIFSLFCILNLISFIYVPAGFRHSMAHMTFLMPVVVSGIFGSRLILNLRESYYEPYDHEFSIRVDVSMADFEGSEDSLHLPTRTSHPNLATPPTVDS